MRNLMFLLAYESRHEKTRFALLLLGIALSGWARTGGPTTAMMPAARALPGAANRSHERCPVCNWPGPIAPAPCDQKTDLIRKAAFEATPILVDNKLFLSTPYNHVIALNPQAAQTLGV